jgi:hypothetical protein
VPTPLGETMTDDIPANATEASVTIAPVCKAAGDRRTARAATCADGSFTQLLDGLVDEQPELARLTPGKPETRLMGCVVLASMLQRFARAAGGLKEYGVNPGPLPAAVKTTFRVN